MYGLISKIRAVAGARDRVAQLILGGSGTMPGCLSYVVALDASDPDALWITEVWDNEASHKASLGLSAVQEAISQARPLIAGFDSRVVTVPVGGIGLPAA